MLEFHYLQIQPIMRVLQVCRFAHQLKLIVWGRRMMWSL